MVQDLKMAIEVIKKPQMEASHGDENLGRTTGPTSASMIL